ncbi:DoxX family protein [Halobacillus locisalis]|uniref:DoxX family protein n=1 Tax=Halobacillus locisalis TaxID=220753 RepID=A0A838CXX1_9BACI|nr:DoxX family protein [Halobacillus locisalis]MBA2176625.1 DoxX family protein [Halobacillus locisalis]
MSQRVEWALLIARIILGVIMIAHGFQKIVGMEQTIQTFDQIGLPPIMAYATAWIEAIAGLTVLVGLYVVPSSILLGLTMIGAIVLVKLPMGLIGGYEFPLALLGFSIILALTGSRKWSLGNMIGST